MENNTERIIQLAKEHGENILSGESKKANKIHKTLSKLISNYNDNLPELLPLIKHKNESVRLWVASFILKNGNIKGKKILEELTHSKSIFSTSAKILLDLYEKGMLI